jgi:hypothetical protein
MFMLPLVEFLPKWPKSQASGRMRAVFRCFGPEGKGKIIYTLRESNVAMETPHLYDFPVKIDIYKRFPITMFDYQMVNGDAMGR